MLFSALFLSFLLLNTTFISCAGGASGPKGSEAEGTALAIKLPDTAKTLYDKEAIVSFTVTVSSGSFNSTKSANKGETLLFSNLPVGTYSVKAYGKTSTGAVAARCETSVKIVAGETTTTTLHLSRLEHWTVTFQVGSTITTQDISDGYTATKPADPVKTNFTFGGWYTSSDGGTTLASAAYDFDTNVTADITLYAKWVEISLPISNLSSYLASLPTGSKEEPNVLPVITGLTTSNWTDIKTALTANSTKFVDLSATALPEGITDMLYGFRDCSNMVKAPSLPNGVTPLRYCFDGCTSLTTAPVIPNGVDNMWGCFYECSSLTTAPSLPNSVTTLGHCFSGCTSLTAAPELPDNVSDIQSCFKDCTGITTAPVIPHRASGGIQMANTFSGCTNLRGDVIIKTSITVAHYFGNTFKDVTGIRVYVPDEATKNNLINKHPDLSGAIYIGEP